MSSKIRAIRSEADYDAALARIDALMDAKANTPEGDELDVLTDLVELYEERHVPMGYPTPVGAIVFRMEQAKLTPRDLIPYIGSRSKVSEVLSGKRPLTMQMARALHASLGIPADVLLQQPGGELASALDGVEWDRFPIAEMIKRHWVDRPGKNVSAEKIMLGLIHQAGGVDTLPAMFRKNDHARVNAKSDPYALKAWCWKVLALANAHTLPTTYKPGTVDPAFLRKVAKLSWSEDGPKLAREFLAKHGSELQKDLILDGTVQTLMARERQAGRMFDHETVLNQAKEMLEARLKPAVKEASQSGFTEGQKSSDGSLIYKGGKWVKA